MAFLGVLFFGSGNPERRCEIDNLLFLPNAGSSLFFSILSTFEGDKEKRKTHPSGNRFTNHIKKMRVLRKKSDFVDFFAFSVKNGFWARLYSLIASWLKRPNFKCDLTLLNLN